MSPSLSLVLLTIVIPSWSQAFLQPNADCSLRDFRTIPHRAGADASSLSPLVDHPSTFFSLQPVFHFLDSARNETDRFERIDDVIMGGISSSALRQLDGESFARWSGVCREDGGGFCGMRTLPFQEPLDVRTAEGMYVTCRLTSDEEPDRRIWKITTRTEKSRGERLYQAMLRVPPSLSGKQGEWHTIHVPFGEFRLVRGARLVPNGERLNTTNGLFQIGMTISKFAIAENTTSIPNFRPGFFELQIQQIGLYSRRADNTTSPIASPVRSLSKEKAMAQRPLLLKILRPISVIAFTENSQRRKASMRLFKTKWRLTHLQATLFGLRWRANQIGAAKSVAKTLSILFVDSARTAGGASLRYGLFLPLRLLVKTIVMIGRIFQVPQTRQKDEAETRA